MKMRPKKGLAWAGVAAGVMVWLLCPMAGFAQARPAQSGPPGPPALPNEGPLVLTLESALARVRSASPQYLAASLDAAIAAEDTVQAKAARLPTVSFFDQFIYTESNGTGPVFVGADGVHVYNTQGVVHADPYSPELRAQYRRALAAEAVAKAKQDLALKGIAASVVENYYAVVGATRRLAAIEQSLMDASSFFDTTQKLERGGEVARADTVKAQLQLVQRRREVEEAKFEIEKARIGLAVLVLPIVTQEFTVVDDLGTVPPIPTLDEIDRLARRASPELRAADSRVLEELMNLSAARSAGKPTVSLDYFFGINANRFATSTDGVRNLGSQAQATLNIPIFNGALKSRVAQADLKRRQAELEAVQADKELAALVTRLYREAVWARSQIDALKSIEDLASESLRLTLLRYQAGEVSVLEVVDAQTTLSEARRAHDDGRVRYRTVWANIQIVTGNF